MERGKMSSTGRGGKSKGPQHPQDIFALGSKSTVVVSRDSEKRNIHKPTTSGVERKREGTSFGAPPPGKRSRIGSPAESVTLTSLEVDPVDLVPHVLQALDTHNSDKLLGLLTGSIRLLKSQRAKPDPILCMSMLYLCKIRPNMFAHEAVTQSLCSLLKREQGAAFKNKGNPLVFVLACNMLYAGHRENKNWPDTFIKVYIEDALNERWWVECSWCKCLVENIVTAFNTKLPPSHLIPSDNTLGTMSPSGSGSPLMGSTDEDTDNTELEYTVFPRYSTSYESVEGLVLEAIKDQIQRRAQPDAIGKGFLKLLSATCGFPEIRMIAASRLEAWLHSGKLWRAAQELLAFVCCNADACGPTAARDHEVLAQLARMRLKTKPLQAAYVNCLREMVSESPALLRSVVTHTIYNELSNVRSPNNLAVLGALVQAQPLLVPQAMADTYQELLLRPEEYLRPLRALTRECVRTARSDASALLPLARALAQPPPHDPSAEVRERAFSSLADLFALCCLLTASHSKHWPQYKQQICGIQTAAVNWLLECIPIYHCSRHEYQLALNKIMFVEPIETYTRVDNWPPESERAATYRLCTEAPLPQSTLLSLIFIGLSKEIPVSPAEVFELIESLVRRACALPPEDNPLQVDKLELADYLFQLCQFHPPDNIALPAGYTPPPLAITSLYWRGWVLLTLIAAHNPQFAERATATYPTLRALTEFCVTGKASIEWSASTAAEAEAERAAVLQLETHLAAASNSKLPVTEHNCRLLTQLTTLEPLGPARRPPAAVLESLQALNTARGLGRLLCRAGSLLVQLVQRHTVRRAMPWLHHLLQRDHLQLSVLPVQCLCEFLSAGAAGVGGGEPGKAGELAAHLRRTIADSAQGARAVLHYYMQRLSHSHAQTRSSAGRGLKLVLTQAEDAVDIDYNAEVSPDEWLDLLWVIPHWELVKEEVVSRIRAACLVECLPRHLAAYIAFLARHMAQEPDVDHTDLILDISQMLMERMCVMGNVLPPAELRETRPAEGEGPLGPQRTLHAITSMLFMHIQQVRNGAADEEGAGGGAVSWGAGERVALQWGTRPRVTLHAIVAHAHLKLLCYGPSIYDTNQEMYNWLLSIWVGDEAPQAFLLETEEEAALLPDWLRLHLVRSARAPLLAAGLRGLSAHTLALFIQTFGLPPQSITALLGALDACPAGAVNRVGVERGYMWQLLRVQRARGARGGGAFAAALQLQPPQHPPPDELFITKPLPVEMEGSWCFAPAQPSLALEQVAPLVSAAFGVATNFSGDLDTSLTQLTQKIVEEANHILSGRSQSSPYTHQTVTYLFSQLSWIGAAMLRNEARAAALCRALSPHSLLPRGHMLKQFAETLLKQYKCCMSPLVSILRDIANIDPAKERSKTKDASRTSEPMVVDQEREDRVEVPSHASKDQLVALLESSTPNSLEELGNRIIESQDTRLVVDVISHILEKNQAGGYDVQIKTEEGAAAMSPHVFARASLGCGLLLDWMSQLQQETLAAQPHRQMRLMFRSGTAPWRPLLATLLAHRASWRTLHACLTALLETDGSWAATSVLDFAETLVRSPRVWQGRDKGTPKHHKPEDSLRLSHRQLRVLVRYILEEARDANANGGSEAMRRGIEARLPLLLQCCPDDAALLCAALTASDVHGTSPHHDMLLLLLYMKVPKTLRLIANSSLRPCSALTLPAQSVASSTSATDRVSHALLTTLADTHQKDKLVRIEAGVRSLWSRHSAAGARALPLVAALLRGLPARSAAVTHLLAAVEMVPDAALFSDENTKDLHDIIECLLNMGAGGPSAGGSGVGALMHRLAAILRRYLASNLQRATAVLHQHWGIVATIPALSSLSLSGAGESGAPSSSLPPPQALQVLQRRSEDPTEMNWPLQELEAWGLRRGGAWGGRDATRDVLRAAAPLLSAPPPPPRDHVRKAARGLLVKILPAVEDTRPGFEAVMECLESGQPELVHSVLDKLAELVCGMMEHAPALLNTVFRLGVTSRYPVEASIAKCVATINLQRGC